jgi:hypothetical protein
MFFPDASHSPFPHLELSALAAGSMLAHVNISKIVIYNHDMGVFDQGRAIQASQTLPGE